MLGAKINSYSFLSRRFVCQFRHFGNQPPLGNSFEDLIEAIIYFGKCEGDSVEASGQIGLGMGLPKLPDRKLAILNEEGSTWMVRIAARLP